MPYIIYGHYQYCGNVAWCTGEHGMGCRMAIHGVWGRVGSGEGSSGSSLCVCVCDCTVTGVTGMAGMTVWEWLNLVGMQGLLVCKLNSTPLLHSLPPSCTLSLPPSPSFVHSSLPPSFMQVSRGGKAEKAGLVSGDFVLTINSTPVEGLKHLQAQQLVIKSTATLELSW